MAGGVRTRLSGIKKLQEGKRSKTTNWAANATRAVLVSVGQPFFRLLTGFLITSFYIFFILRKLFSLWATTLGKAKEPNKIYKKRYYSKISKSITLTSYSLCGKFRQYLSLLPSKLLYIRGFDFKSPKPVLIAGFLAFFGSGLALAFWYTVLKDLPRPEDSNLTNQPVSTKIYDRNGNLLYKIYSRENRTILPLGQIPLSARQATIAIEDAEFYSHPGFSIKGIVRSIFKNLTQRGDFFGGSTITQQLVKNTLLTPQKTFTRKIKELVLAVKVESKYSKDQILEMYLNQVSYGGAAYGIEEASQLYFGKSGRDLSLPEAALLAGLPKSPTRFSPFGSNPQISKTRQKEVLLRMKEAGFITESQATEALKQKIVLAPQKTDIKAPHFVMYTKEILASQWGEKMVEEGGLEVMTTLDLPTQEKAEKIVAEEVAKLKNLRVGNGAALVVNPQNGEILALVGSKDYFNEASGNFNVTDSPRQPGSAIKVVNYAYALEAGMTPATILFDEPITFSVPGQPPYTPKNYDNKFLGRIPLRVALASSRNVPAVRVLAGYGVGKMLELAKKMGITTWEDSSRFGLSLTLGGGEVKMTDLAVVYGTLANYGKKVPLTPIRQVKDWRGKVLQKKGCGKIGCLAERVISAETAFQILDILKDNQARSSAFGTHSLLVVPNHPEIAVKTGTTNNLRDNWAIGFNQNYLVSAWVGNNDNTPMSWIASGVTGATPIWHKIMRVLVDGVPSQPWEAPQGLVQVPICPSTGTLPCAGCQGVAEWFREGTEPKQACALTASVETQL